MRKERSSASRLIVVLLLPCLAFGQTIDEPVESIRHFSGAITYTALAQLETISATTGKPVLTGTAAKLGPFSFITDSVVFADLLGNKTTATIISGFRATFTMVPSVTAGWEQVAPFAVRKTFKTPITLAAGQFIGCRYDMPLIGAGNIKCMVGVKAATITAFTPPPPPPPTGASPAGASIPPLAQLTDNSGAVWTLVNTIVSRNGIDLKACDIGYCDVNSLIVSQTGTIRIVSPTHGYICWNGVWASSGC